MLFVLTHVAQNFFINARPIIKSFQKSNGRKMEQMTIALIIFRKKYKSMRLGVNPSAFLQTTVWCQIRIHADNQFYSFLFTFLIHVDNAIERAIIGESESIHAVFFYRLNKGLCFGECSKKRIMRVDV